MEEKDLVKLPDEVAQYLEYMKRNNYTLLGSLKVSCVTGKFTDYMDDYFSVGSNQEKFALARTSFTKEELEEAGFSWVFDSPLTEVLEVL